MEDVDTLKIFRPHAGSQVWLRELGVFLELGHVLSKVIPVLRTGVHHPLTDCGWMVTSNLQNGFRLICSKLSGYIFLLSAANNTLILLWSSLHEFIHNLKSKDEPLRNSLQNEDTPLPNFFGIWGTCVCAACWTWVRL